MKNKKNIVLSFDIEDWFQVPFAASNIRREKWETFKTITPEGTNLILAFLKKHDIKATFFVLGWIADKYPDLIKFIHNEGHEIASHGYYHETLDNLNQEDLSDDLDKSIDVLNKITGCEPAGYRAPLGSIGDNNKWVLHELRKKGFKYDSSIYPTNLFVHSGSRSIQTEIHEIIDNLLEVPFSVETFMKIPIPLSGGFYIRSIPFFIYKKLLKKHACSKKNTILYFHPWEFDTNYPKVIKNPIKYFIQYYNLNSVRIKLEKLFDIYSFISIKEKLRIEKFLK